MRQQLPLEEKTVAELLKRGGLRHARASASGTSAARASRRSEQGFDVVHAGRRTRRRRETEGGKGEYDLTAQAEQFIDANKDRPFFLYLAHNNPHIPLAAKPELVEEPTRRLQPVYAACIETLDDSVGRMLEKLDELGLSERTIVIFTSDNGGLHVPEGPRPADAQHAIPRRQGLPLRGRPARAADRPLAGQVPPGAIIDDAGHQHGLAADAARAGGRRRRAGSTASADACLRTGNRRSSADALLALPALHQPGRPAGGGRAGGQLEADRALRRRPAELFDLDADESESRNRSKAEPGRTAVLRQRLREWRSSVAAQENTPNPGVDARLYDQLYVEFDPTRFDPLRADDQAWKAVALWRQRMDAAVKLAAAPK